MFLLTNKALIWVGKGQKEKPIIITTWAVMGEVWYQGCQPRIGRPSKSERYQGRVSPTRIRVLAIFGNTKRKPCHPLGKQGIKS